MKDVDGLVGNFPAQDEPKSASKMLFLMNRPATDQHYGFTYPAALE
jgi:hypothetical protein